VNYLKAEKVTSSTLNNTVIGVFESECADADITNRNGIDITREVWETTFSSDDFKQGIELGWFIGFLGHPEDPNCMDFKNACIVMTEGWMGDDGKIKGKFNLIDTPVGRIVKAFIDAGVTFGISLRGVGDIVNNSVDPETFVFRGFDLVSFPAYPEAIPTFSEIAASTDLESQKKYKTICAAVKTNVDSITSCNTLDVIQSQFAKQSDEYAAVEARKHELSDDLEDLDITEEKLNCMTELYLDVVNANRELKRQLASLKSELRSEKVLCRNKVKSVTRITNAQIRALEKNAILASDQFESEISSLKQLNLKYKQKMMACTDTIQEKDSIISGLRSELHETVMGASDIESRTSNLDAKNRKLKQDLLAAQKLVEEYQDAYAKLYSNAIGAHLENISITATTSVSEMKSLINSRSANNTSYAFTEPVAIDLLDPEEDSDIITV